MASPQLENGFTRIANELLEALYRTRLTGGEWDIVMCILRASFGWSKKVAPVSVGEVARRLGKHYSHTKQTVRELITRGILERQAQGIRIIKDYERWGGRCSVPGTVERPGDGRGAQGGTVDRPMGGTNFVPTSSLNPTSPKGRQPRKESSKEITKENLVGDSAPTGGNAPKRRGRDNGKTTDPNVKLVIDTYHNAFLERHGTPPPIAGGKCGQIAKTMLRGRPAEEAVWVVREFFKSPPQFFRERGLYGFEHVLKAMPTLLARKAEIERGPA
jgi:phage replication O-like protein O